MIKVFAIIVLVAAGLAPVAIEAREMCWRPNSGRNAFDLGGARVVTDYVCGRGATKCRLTVEIDRKLAYDRVGVFDRVCASDLGVEVIPSNQMLNDDCPTTFRRIKITIARQPNGSLDDIAYVAAASRLPKVEDCLPIEYFELEGIKYDYSVIFTDRGRIAVIKWED